MYLVLKGFANNDISAVKGKVIKNLDKDLASALIEAGYITPYSKQEMSNKEKDEEIKNLNSQLVEKDAEIQTLKDTIEELENKIKELTALPTDNADELKNSDDNGDNLDNNSDSTPNEDDKNKGEESKENPDGKIDDDKSSKK